MIPEVQSYVQIKDETCPIRKPNCGQVEWNTIRGFPPCLVRLFCELHEEGLPLSPLSHCGEQYIAEKVVTKI